MSSVFIEDGIGIEIHNFEGSKNNLMIYLPDQEKTYFLTPDNYHYQLQSIKCRYAVEIESAIVKFLNQKETV